MAQSATKRFRAVLEPLGGNLGWVVARLPFDVEMAWKKMVRLRVLDVAFRSAEACAEGGGGLFEGS